MTTLTRTLRSIYETGNPAARGQVGIEVEVEFDRPLIRTPSEGFDENWCGKYDGSLRQFGHEFVTIGPMSLNRSHSALGLLVGMLDKQSFLKDSPRTSMHVHINVLDLTAVQVATAVTAYWLLEDALFNMFDKYRRINLFCLPLRQAQASVYDLISAFACFARPFTQLRNHKYGAVNLSSVALYGTLEFRGRDGSINLPEMRLWVSMLYDLVHTSSSRFTDPRQLLDTVLQDVQDTGQTLSQTLLQRLFKDATHIARVYALLGGPDDDAGARRRILEATKRVLPLAYAQGVPWCNTTDNSNKTKRIKSC